MAKIKINEEKLKSIIKAALKEQYSFSTNEYNLEGLNKLREVVSDETIINYLATYFSSDAFNDFVSSLLSDYGLDYDDKEAQIQEGFKEFGNKVKSGVKKVGDKIDQGLDKFGKMVDKNGTEMQFLEILDRYGLERPQCLTDGDAKMEMLKKKYPKAWEIALKYSFYNGKWNK